MELAVIFFDWPILNYFPHMEVIEERDSEKDADLEYKCGRFVFSDDWIKKIDYSEGFTDETILDHSRISSSERRCGDIVAYLVNTPSLEIEGLQDSHWKHVGRVSEDPDKIISKWGVGPIVKHPLDFVPRKYGDEVRFFRKDE